MPKIEVNKDTALGRINGPNIPQSPRSYMGMSGLGHACPRYLWYNFRRCFLSSHSPRMLRLFGRGHREEKHLIIVLQNIGIQVWGDQTGFEDHDGYIKGHCDGFAKGVIEAPLTTHIAEFKTMNDKSFKSTHKKGVEKDKPIYYAQMQLYMKYSGCKRALFMAVNKNDDNIYIERVKYVATTANMLVARGKSIVDSPEPPPRAFSKTWFECRFCDARSICHNGGQIRRSCRTCEYTRMIGGGGWGCTRLGEMIEIPDHIDVNGCEHYRRGFSNV